jgi:hypothetical protein
MLSDVIRFDHLDGEFLDRVYADSDAEYDF